MPQRLALCWVLDCTRPVSSPRAAQSYIADYQSKLVGHTHKLTNCSQTKYLLTSNEGKWGSKQPRALPGGWRRKPLGHPIGLSCSGQLFCMVLFPAARIGCNYSAWETDFAYGKAIPSLKVVRRRERSGITTLLESQTLSSFSVMSSSPVLRHMSDFARLGSLMYPQGTQTPLEHPLNERHYRLHPNFLEVLPSCQS